MIAKRQRLQYVNNFLKVLGGLRPLVASSRDELVFEFFCYFRKVDELIKRGKTPLLKNVHNRIFAPHSKPSNPLSASYISFKDVRGAPFDLFLNGQFEGRSGVDHSPDIVLRETKSGKILSIYECKKHSGTLDLRYYREFIGYLQEMKVQPWGRNKTFRNFLPELRPCIYTSAKANPSSGLMRDQYDFYTIDRL
ncbi:MAG: hypothetical protein JSV12_07015 [Candidatus Bathyarchaeota archaeon]|nr:MAG: hypothetical protein JSV12_07015 [Candidatus Bathyarchaeota archaeon]